MYLTDCNKLTEEEKFLIIDSFARTKNVAEVKKEFNSLVGSGRRIDGPVILAVAKERKEELTILRKQYDATIDDIPIASLRKRLQMLTVIHEAAMEEKVIGTTSTGTDIVKQDLPTALRCVEAADRIINTYELTKIRKQQGSSGGDDDEDLPTLTCDVVHRKDPSEDDEDEEITTD